MATYKAILGTKLSSPAKISEAAPVMKSLRCMCPNCERSWILDHGLQESIKRLKLTTHFGGLMGPGISFINPRTACQHCCVYTPDDFDEYSDDLKIFESMLKIWKRLDER